MAEDTDSEPEEDALHVDGFDIVARHPGSIVGAGKNKGIPVSPAEDSAKTALSKLSVIEKAKQVKKNELFVSPDGKLTKAKKQGSMGVADANRAHFDNVVAPTLLPPDLAQFRSLSTTVTYARLGSVAVLNQFDALVKFQGNVPASNFEMRATISDLGETWQGQVRKCEPISSAAAYRTDVDTVVSQMERDAKLWTQHDSTPGQAPL